ncbi:hypothetical protein KIPB_003649 [Kipferlia bialata]|uniref:Uncharacterized protein n=1 Tax=Kipferlia bialata TaxID=797122 RepID=A0A9K3GHL2_9EUKA|nr:hypothetical protein KIPB_003649 [Kipferlia bialata]|eukprot:g3649.t1
MKGFSLQDRELALPLFRALHDTLIIGHLHDFRLDGSDASALLSGVWDQYTSDGSRLMLGGRTEHTHTPSDSDSDSSVGDDDQETTEEGTEEEAEDTPVVEEDSPLFADVLEVVVYYLRQIGTPLTVVDSLYAEAQLKGEGETASEGGEGVYQYAGRAPSQLSHVYLSALLYVVWRLGVVERVMLGDSVPSLYLPYLSVLSRERAKAGREGAAERLAAMAASGPSKSDKSQEVNPDTDPRFRNVNTRDRRRRGRVEEDPLEKHRRIAALGRRAVCLNNTRDRLVQDVAHAAAQLEALDQSDVYSNGYTAAGLASMESTPLPPLDPSVLLARDKAASTLGALLGVSVKASQNRGLSVIVPHSRDKSTARPSVTPHVSLSRGVFDEGIGMYPRCLFDVDPSAPLPRTGDSSKSKKKKGEVGTVGSYTDRERESLADQAKAKREMQMLYLRVSERIKAQEGVAEIKLLGTILGRLGGTGKGGSSFSPVVDKGS